MRLAALLAMLIVAMLPLAGCGDSSPPVVQVDGGSSSGGVQAQTIEQQLVNMQNQIDVLQQQVDALRAKAGQ